MFEGATESLRSAANWFSAIALYLSATYQTEPVKSYNYPGLNLSNVAILRFQRESPLYTAINFSFDDL